MKWPMSRTATVGLALTLAVLLSNAWVFYALTRRMVENERWVVHTHDVLTDLEGVLATVPVAETGGEARALVALGHIDNQLDALKERTADNPDQQARLNALHGLVKAARSAALRKGETGPLTGLRAVVAEMQQEERELLHRRGDALKAELGRLRVFALVATLLPVGLVLLVHELVRRDATHRRRAERALRETERFARATLDALTARIAILDEGGKVVAVNRAWQALPGPAPLAGLGAGEDCLAACENVGSGADLAEGARAVLRGEALSFERERQFPVAGQPHWFMARVTPFADEGPARVVLALEDVTEHKRAEEERRRLTNYNQLLLGSTGEGVYGLDAGGKCTFLNRAAQRLLDLRPEQALGQDMHALVHHTRPDGAPYPVEECPISLTLRTGQGCRMDDDVLWRPDGTSFPADFSCIAVAEGGAVQGAVVTFVDITARKSAEKELREAKEAAEAANAAKSTFLANMSHELRTPLNAVIMYSELLQEQAEDAGTTELIADLEKIRRAGKQLLALVNGVLDLSKIEAGKMELYLETFDVAGVVTDVTSTVQPLVAKRGNELEVVCPPELGRMHADLTKVRQALFNLLANASKFTEKGKFASRSSAVRRTGGIGSRSACATPASAWGLTRLPGSFSRSPRPTPRPRAASAAPDWAWPSRASFAR